VEGLFKKTPAPSDLEAIKQAVDKGLSRSFHTPNTPLIFCTDLRGEYTYELLDPHTLAALLKSFLKDLPDPLFTNKLFPDFMKADSTHACTLFY